MIAQIADREQSAHLSAHVHPVQAEFLLSADSLPYEKLGGPGFERLCYLLLLTRGHSPLFFGSSGQAQRGIDLLVEEDGERVVYQCKNVKNFSTPDAIAALKKFEVEWLQPTHLPKPKRFVLCLTRSLRDVKDLDPWEKYREEFSQKHQIEVATPWDRTYLNETLKRLPDIVAEIFSDQIAELFCERDDWVFDQFHPLAVNATEPSLKRYFARKTTDHLYLDPERIAEFTEKLERNGSILIKGLPGSGKTITSLALTEELNRYRVYYLSLRDNVTNDLLVAGIKDRLSRRTIFVLDDCQGKFAQLDSLMTRIRRLLQGRPLNQALFVFLTRTTPTPDDLARGDEITGFEEDLKQAGAVLEFATNQQTFRQIIEQGKPEFADLTAERLVNLYEFTGHDLFLLDQLLDTLDDPEELDDLNLESLFGKTIVRYFGSNAVDRPGFMHLAALAQFDLAPRTAGFPYNLKAEDPRAMVELVAEAGHPLHYFFLHSSAAELIFRALALNHGTTDHAGRAAEHLIAFFKGRAPDDPTLADDLSKAIHNHLKLVDKNQEERLKSAFLADDAIYELIERNFVILPLNLFAVCRIILRDTTSPALERYEGLIQRMVEDGTVLQLATTKPFVDSELFLRLNKRHYPQLFNYLRKHLAATGLRSLARSTELQNFLGLLLMVAEPNDTNWHDLLAQVPESDVETMIERTITAGRSIGRLNLALSELKQNDEPLLRQLESQIGAARFLRLIAANGTIFELFMVIKCSTLTLAEELIAALDDNLVEQLLAQTIDSGRSIGTLDLALLRLKQKDIALLRRLEVQIGAANFLRLIAANGTVPELFRVIKSSTLVLAEELIAALDDKLVEQLITQTITAGRSLGTLHQTLRELKQNDEELLRRLEVQIGAARFLRLIAANGTIFELFMVIKDSTPALKEELIASLDDQLVEQLIAQTVATGRSIGTLNIALLNLKQNDIALLRRLEAQIGAARFLRLIAANGTIFELFMQIRNSTLAEELIAGLDDRLVEQLVTQTITARRSIGTLNLALRELKQRDAGLLRRLEVQIGAARFLRLIAANGSLLELFWVIQDSTLALADELIAGLDGQLVDQLITRTITTGRSIGTLNLALRKLKRNDIALLRRLEAQIGGARFLRLIAANGSIVELFWVIKASTRPLKEALIAGLDDQLVEQLISQTISTGRSIGALHWTLQHLKLINRVLLRKLEDKIGTNRWWRLIWSFGSIAILVELLPAMDSSFRQDFIQAAKRLSAEEWKELLRKNGLYELCYLVEKFPWFFSTDFPPEFLKQIIVTLIQSSSWEARNLGWVQLSNAPDSMGKRYLLKLINEQFRDTQPGALDFLSFSEAAHAVNLLWRLLPDRRNELVDALRRFIHTDKPIYSDPTYLVSVHLLFSTLATPQARPADARIILSLGNDASVAKLCAKAMTPDLFLYLWNLYALWFEWKSPQERSFTDFLNAELGNALISSFTGRLRAGKDDEEADALITLAGAMSFLGMSCDRSSALEDFLSKIPSEDEMIFSLDQTQSFIPSVFFLLGLEWIFQDERAVPPLVWREQLVKTNKYPEATAALEHLKSLVTTRSRLA